MTEDTYTVFTPYGIVRATFPEDAGIAMEGHEDAIAAVRRAILASIDERGMTTTPEALDPDRFVQWCQGPDSSITIVPPAMDGMEPEPLAHPEEADMQQADTITLDGVEELPGMRAAIAAAASPMERIALVKAMKAAQAAWAAEQQDAGLTRAEYQAVANTILQQLGGNKFKVMTGAKNFAAITRDSGAPNGGLSFQLPSGLSQINGKGTGINRVVIRLNASDTYDVDFASSRGMNYTVKATATDIYADVLREVFTRYTGLDTSLGSAGPRPQPATRKFTDLTPEEQRAQIAAEKAAVTDEQVDRFMDTWKQASADYVATGFRVAGIVPGIGYVQLMKGEAIPQLTTPEGDSSVDLNPEQVADLRDAIRSGALDIAVFRRWGNGADARSPVKMLYRGNATFKPFDYTFELLSRTGSDMGGLTAEQRRRVEQALKETEAMLAKQLAYSADMQKPMMIEWYRAHADYLRAVLAGTAKIGEGPKPTEAQNADWDTTVAVLEERAKQAAEASSIATPLDPLLVEWKPRFRTSAPPQYRTLPSRNRDGLFFVTVQDADMLGMVANATLNGAPHQGADRARKQIAQIKAAESAGFSREKFMAAGLNQLIFLWVKDGLALTREGAEKIAAGSGGESAPTEEPAGPYPYRYALVNRPADLGTVPKGVKYTVEPRPAAGQPHADMARHGILTTERELTAEELKAFELAPLVDGDDLGVMAEAIARGMAEYASGYLEQATEDPDYFRSRVMQGVDMSESGVKYSIGDPAALVQKVRDKLAAMVPATPKPDAALGTDMQFLQEVVDGKHPAMLEPELADDIEAAILRHPGDAALQALGERAIIAYSNSLMKATGG